MSPVPSLTIRDIPADDLRWLRSRAAGARRSLNREILDLLAVARADEEAARHPRNPFARTLRRARALGIRTPASGKQIIRRDRDSRP